MTDDPTDDLSAILRKLGSSDPFDRQEAFERLQALDAARLVELAGHGVEAVREGVARAIGGRTEPELIAVAMQLARDGERDVRLALAKELGRRVDWDVPDELLQTVAKDDVDDVATLVIARLGERRTCRGFLARLVLDNDTDWEVRQGCIRALDGQEDANAAVRMLLEIAGRIENEWLGRECLRLVEERLGAIDELPEDALPSADAIQRTSRAAASWTDADVPRVRKMLEANVPVVPDLAALAEYGKDLTTDARRGALPRAFHLGTTVEAVERVLDGDGNRSIVLTGPTGAGKTAVVHELVHRLASREDRPWRVLRVSPNEMLVGTKYLGEWQTKVKSLVNLIAAPQRVLLYVPNLGELSEVGASEQNEQASVATLLAPEIESGRIAVLGESTPDAWSRGMGSEGHLKRLFARVEVAPLTRDESRDVLELVALDADADVAADALDVTLDVADVYLSDIELPGRAVGLLRRMIAEGERERYERGDVLRTLQEATGVPPDFLDDSIPLRTDLLRDFFEARVMGQPDAVSQVIDLVTLIKAGLDDPNKPSGVMLFVGPTGVGKTELSRALAELLFGDPSRLLRFDMSEYASYESYERLIGTKSREGTLTDAVRRQPFSVVLLDEIEKSHQNVFDLCLQIFDAGRLTDGKGRTVSFRKTIVVMTSNLGAKIETEAGIGFDGAAPPPPTSDEIERALRQFFRPEFLGRVDHVVRFDALSTETADRIARREVERVLARGGLTRRRVSVDVDPGVYSLLLRRGYSPSLGARPLKRAVESLLLMPVARLLAAGDARPGSCVQLSVAGDAIRAKLVPPDDDETPVEVVPATAPALDAEIERAERLRERAAVLEERRATLLERSNETDFWDDPRAAARSLDTVHRIDRLLEELARLESELEITAANSNPRAAARFLARHALDGRRLERLFDADELGDAYVRLTGIRTRQGGADGGLQGVERLGRMYANWARRRRMECRVLDDRTACHDTEDTITLAIEGTGAHALLSGETGLHKLRRDRAGEASRSEMVRVEVLPMPADGGASVERDTKTDVRALRDASGRLVTTLRCDVHLLHRPTMTSLRASSPEPESDALASLRGLLAALVTAESAADLDVVRRYGFGPSSVIRDRRTGRSTGRVDRVLGGELDLIADV